jgi:hypothetical protein
MDMWTPPAMILQIIEQLEPILETMNLPESRKIVTSTNTGWLLRNINVMNTSHPDIEIALNLLKRIAKGGRI